MRRTVAIALLLLIASSPALPAEDALDGWDRRHRALLKSTADGYERLAKWAAKHRLEKSAARAWRRLLVFDSDHADARAWFGYTRGKSGAWTWPLARRQVVRELVDGNEKKATEFHRRFRDAERRAADRLLALGNTAEFRTGKEPERVEKWNERMFTAFTLLLRISPGEERARERLGHPEFEGRRVDPRALRYLEARSARRQAGKAAAKAGFDVVSRGVDHEVEAIGLLAHSARSRNFTVVTTWGQETARGLAVSAEQALAEVIRVNGFPGVVADRKRIRTIYLMRDAGQIRLFLQHFSDWDKDRIERQLKRFNNAWFAPFSVVARIQGDARLIDTVMQYGVRKAIRAFRKMSMDALDDDSKVPDLEPWLLDALATDVVMRLTGDSLSNFSEVPDYSHERRVTEGRDRWMALARERVESDDDVSFARLTRLRLIDLNPACSVKGHGLIQYLFESDAAKARRFVAVALVHGSAAAAKKVYESSLAGIDAGYRDWVRLTW